MPNPLITIEERMYSVGEVARMTEHRIDYIRDLVESGVLLGLRPETSNGGQGQWRIYPESLRKWLGIGNRRLLRRKLRQAERETMSCDALMEK